MVNSSMTAYAGQSQGKKNDTFLDITLATHPCGGAGLGSKEAACPY